MEAHMSGRPKLYEAALSKEYCLRMDPEMYYELAAKARDQKVTMAELMRVYITWGLEAK